MNKQKGFTIIEVALVLAIAGLIFAMTFIALPGLWAAERDSERKSDMLDFAQTLTDFQTNNNRGALPTTPSERNDLANGREVIVTWDGIKNTVALGNENTGWAEFYEDFLGEAFVDPNGNNYELVVTNCGTSTPDAECTTGALGELAGPFVEGEQKIYVVVSGVCGDEAKPIATANSRRVAILYRLEASGVYCTNT